MYIWVLLFHSEHELPNRTMFHLKRLQRTERASWEVAPSVERGQLSARAPAKAETGRAVPSAPSVCLSVEKSLACSTVPASNAKSFPFLPLLSNRVSFFVSFLTRYSPGQFFNAILWRVAIDGCFGGLYFRAHGWSV